MSALAYVADITNQPTETRLMRGQGLCFLHCWWKHQAKCWSWEALLPASFEVKFRYGSCSWNARPHVLQKQIYTLLLQKDAAFNLKSKVIREGKLTAMEPLIWVRQPVQVISVSPASPLWSRRGHYPCGGRKAGLCQAEPFVPRLHQLVTSKCSTWTSFHWIQSLWFLNFTPLLLPVFIFSCQKLKGMEKNFQLCCTLKTNVILYDNYISIKN